MSAMTNWTRPVGALAMATLLTFGAAPVFAQEGTPTTGQSPRIDLTDAPVEMHEGTCANPTLDPWTTIGRLQREEYGAALDDGIAIDPSADTEGFLSEDLDNNGILDDGEDLDADGVLDVGIDADGDGVISDAEMIGDGKAVVAVVNLPTFYMTQGEISSGFEPLFGQQNVIAVHQSSEQYENIVACGNLGGVDYQDEDEIVIGLRSMNDSAVRGYAVFEFDPNVFADDVTAVTVYVFQGLPSQRDNMMMGAESS